jgi:hypothetical protein
MTTHKTSAARIAKAWLDVVFVLGAIVCVALLLWLLAAPVAMTVSDAPGDVALRVAIGERSLRPVMPMTGGGVGSVSADSLRVVDATGELRFVTTDWWLHLASAGHMLVGAILVLYGIYVLRKILATVVDEHPFAPSNVHRMRILGFLLLGIGILRPLVEYLVALLVLSRITVETVVLSPPVGFSVDAILGGLLLLVLATIFDYGSWLEQERSLTV